MTEPKLKVLEDLTNALLWIIERVLCVRVFAAIRGEMFLMRSILALDMLAS